MSKRQTQQQKDMIQVLAGKFRGKNPRPTPNAYDIPIALAMKNLTPAELERVDELFEQGMASGADFCKSYTLARRLVLGMDPMPIPKQVTVTKTPREPKTGAGWVYVLSNEIMPGVAKIGYTKAETVAERVEDLSGATGVPVPFDIVAEFWIESCAYSAEQAVHKALDDCRVNQFREFFKGDPVTLAGTVGELLRAA
ncbi:hypothetical protein JCM19240_3987 [Vibrio maritimus]|uniref:Bacteriophage T5 Orf172 DNA-binding domain-containing protein n=1 Tax=Vibrio maritimus TaxID=990268 RepID=A0A090TEG0_9VIBR|nr:hypothetical protein JCM19240_3987 [Vibrio maritimus]